MMFGYENEMSGWMWLLMGLGQLAFWGTLIAAGFVLFRASGFAGSRSGRLQGPSQLQGPGQLQVGTPAQILAGRFASGEIDEAEYRRMLGVIGQHDDEQVPRDR